MGEVEGRGGAGDEGAAHAERAGSTGASALLLGAANSPAFLGGAKGSGEGAAVDGPGHSSPQVSEDSITLLCAADRHAAGSS